MEEFTSNEEVDSKQVGETMIDMYGYVIKMQDNLYNGKSVHKYCKIIVSNNNGREVQVIAWNEFIQKLKEVSELGMRVLISGATANSIKNPIYNKGNVNYELLLDGNSSVSVMGLHTEKFSHGEVAEGVSVLEAYEKVHKLIKIDAYVKTVPQLHVNRDFKAYVGSISDCHYKIEVKFNFDPTPLHLLKGNRVIITGTVEKMSQGPVILRVDQSSHVYVDSDSLRVSFKEMLNGFRVKKHD